MKNMKKTLALTLVVLAVMAVAMPALAGGWQLFNGPGYCYNTRWTRICTFNTGTALTYNGVTTVKDGVTYCWVTGRGFNSAGTWATHSGWVQETKVVYFY